eukprot:TRINITY_DN391_c0_g5_i1.p1 TRINITY_DN391_c0_g5~~TRINITY_DN391_c0_g5_i1.p1  ORF type:complete len:270 (-),score=108.52 TRINITY_DN391_c0_g5_i1:94-903(-)
MTEKLETKNINNNLSGTTTIGTTGEIKTTDDLTFISTHVSTSTTEGNVTPSNQSFLNSSSNSGLNSPSNMNPILPTPALEYVSQSSFSWLLELEEPHDSLDQSTPLLEELDIDIGDILHKIRCALLPINIKRESLVDNPDFWGPMFVVLLYAFLIIWGQLKVISWVLTIWALGSFIIFVIGRALGAEITFSQSLGTLGYCLIPLDITAALLTIITIPWAIYTLKIIGTVWGSASAGILLVPPELQNKRILIVYPILLLYIYFMSLQGGA